MAALLSLDPTDDVLTVQEYGTVWDGQPQEQIHVLVADERIGFLLDEPGGERHIAVAVHEPFAVDPRGIDAPEVWESPRFVVPTFGPEPLTIGEILLLVHARYGPEEPTNDALHFHAAIQAQADNPDVAISLYRLAIEAGDLKGHYGAGYMLLEQGHPAAAAEHLQIYTRLTPHNAWAWCWLGKAHAALNETTAARAALERALAIEDDGGFETDAAELLESLG